MFGSDLRYRLRALFQRGAMERELDAELQFHLDEAIAAHVRSGKSVSPSARASAD